MHEILTLMVSAALAAGVVIIGMAVNAALPLPL